MENLMPEVERPDRHVTAAVEAIEARLDSYAAPQAFGLGVATIGPSGQVLDVSYPRVDCDNMWAAAALLAEATGYRGGTSTHRLSPADLDDVVEALADADDSDGARHARDVWQACRDAASIDALGGERQLVAAFIDNLYQPPVDEIDAYLRLHLLSHREIRPNSCNLNGIFSLLNTVVWTNLGPFEPEDFELTRMRLRAAGHQVEVHLVDKFPRMLDYVVPTGVRIADANRVRLGAHLSEGTVVMHEGYCNFNAGTLGAAMVEGRISQGVIVGDHSDVGGGASIMGTLSGGGEQVISIGENCLLGANSGLGISLGNDCIVEAGLYITAGTRVTFPDGAVVKARDLSGADGLLFRRHSETGRVEAVPREGAGWTGLNQELHAT